MELKSDVYVSVDQHLISTTVGDELLALIEFVDKLSNGMSRYLIKKIKADQMKQSKPGNINPTPK